MAMTLRTGRAWENSEEAECRRGLCKYLYKKWGAGKRLGNTDVHRPDVGGRSRWLLLLLLLLLLLCVQFNLSVVWIT